MANVQKCLEAIKSAIYGEEVRGSIHDAIKSMNEEVVSTVDALGAATETANTAASNANVAAGAANSAANAASAATLESNEATIAANTAAQSANSAAGRAEKASEDCAAATSAANTATTNANNAAGSAASAAENASNAARNAAQSSDKAQQAASDATDASTAANTAAARANAAANNAENIGGVADKTVEFAPSAERTNIESGESVKTVFGKIKKWFADLGTSAFATISNALNVESSGYVMDARQGKVLKDLIDTLGLDVGDLTALQTTDKDSLVNAINNLAEAVSTLNSKIIDTQYTKSYTLSLPTGKACLAYAPVAGFYCLSISGGITVLNIHKSTEEMQYTVNNSERTVTFSAKNGDNIRLIIIYP
ncbi:hypothetical protein [Frisingicoccus sp.]|uniref:hypothetical protein n=1 Tax=Frisingicoccus sp. TaxID=1918627 RepID=UPI003AB50641